MIISIGAMMFVYRRMLRVRAKVIVSRRGMPKLKDDGCCGCFSSEV